jgi:plasmid maintenance system antidote protein VapI
MHAYLLKSTSNILMAISTNTDLRLSLYFGTSAEFWLNLQRQFVSETLSRTLGPEIERIAPRRDWRLRNGSTVLPL